MESIEVKVGGLLRPAGIEINGSNPWDIQVHDDRFYSRILSEGSLGLGESYMDGWWDCDQIDELFSRFIKLDLESKLDINFSLISLYVKARLLNLQSKRRSVQVAKEHYDLETVLFEKMLDKNMQYTCGYWEKAKTLDEAQIAKMDLICRKLQLKSGMTFLDIGSGWGQLANYAAENFGVKAMGITISKEQLRYCQETYTNSNLSFKLCDYRDMKGEFDRISTVGMIEHVGYKNYRKFLKKVDGLLVNDGLYLLHTIGGDKSMTIGDPWLMKYIFPGSVIPSAKQLSVAAEGIFIMEDWHNFGAYYDKTLMAWMKNFGESWGNLKKIYDDRFYRMWRYYLLMCAGCFRARNGIQLWQIVFSKSGVSGGYKSIR